MPVDFFATPCNNVIGNCQTELVHCLHVIPNDIFGFTDANAHLKIPAKLLLNNQQLWDFEVENNSNFEISFKAIDYCIEIYRTGTYNLEEETREKVQYSISNNPLDGEPAKRCEGFLIYNNKILFFEIKTGRYGSWLTTAREQLEETILSFEFAHPHHNLDIQKPIVSNKKCIVHQNLAYQKKILKAKVGFEFELQYKLTL